MKFRDIKAHVERNPYIVLGDNKLYLVTSITTSELRLTKMATGDTNYFISYRKMFTNHKLDIRLFYSREKAMSLHVELFI